MLRFTPVSLLIVPILAAAQAPIAQRENLAATVWMQRSAEMSAVTRTVYRAATAALPAARKAGTGAALEQENRPDLPGKPAIVLDIDETVLNNMPYNAAQAANGEAWTASSWENWVLARKAGGIDGAAEFIRAARDMKFTVIFISNRECRADGRYDSEGRALDCPQKAATLDNLETVLGYRPGDDDVLLRNERRGRDDSNKSARRREVAGRHRIAMLLGDDLEDFVTRARFDPARHAERFGTVWFALPNPVYGSWRGPYRDTEALYRALEPWRRQ
ncbi:5'-nucleotidase, lipoprotein e(P4) family [Paludibacterium paludis]|nr:HAD family acid phosphatase [Paludibacterium paludis]